MRRPSKATIITAVVAGFIGIAIGSAGSSDTSDTEAAPTPATATVTEAAPTAATVTTTEAAPTPAAVTTTDTKTVTPPSCVDALDASEVVVTEDVVAMLDVVAEMPALIPRSIQAGIDRDVAAVKAITRDLKGQNRRITTINADVDRHIGAYNEAATDCRNAS